MCPLMDWETGTRREAGTGPAACGAVVAVTHDRLTFLPEEGWEGIFSHLEVAVDAVARVEIFQAGKNLRPEEKSSAGAREAAVDDDNREERSRLAGFVARPHPDRHEARFVFGECGSAGTDCKVRKETPEAARGAACPLVREVISDQKFGRYLYESRREVAAPVLEGVHEVTTWQEFKDYVDCRGV